MIGNHNLQFTNATRLNDPFDCHPKLLDYSRMPASEAQRWFAECQKIVDESNAFNLRNNTWLCSLSEINDSILMWAHYCYNHKGICIGLDLDKVMESYPPMLCENLAEPLIIDVQYKDIIERPNGCQSTIDTLNYQWKTKARDWAYEKEVRIVMPYPTMESAALTPEQAEHPEEVWDSRDIHHYIDLKGECFDSIYFGVDTDEAEKDWIIAQAQKLNPHINLYQMLIDDNAFRLNPEVIKPLNSDLSLLFLYYRVVHNSESDERKHYSSDSCRYAARLRYPTDGTFKSRAFQRTAKHRDN
ncbi:MAG: DUF2971 domain-containing protein [Prevotella sp.]|nr:DUF2971 domain-containing protein [Prevotella sp.]